jgi:predicted transcriptional regulator
MVFQKADSSTDDTKRIGKALETVIRRDEQIVEKVTKKKVIETVLLSTARQDIYQYLCTQPCSWLSKISADLKISAHAVKWHLKKMVEKGYVSEFKIGKKTVFYPAGFVSDDDIKLLAMLNDEKAKLIFIHITENTGCAQKDLTRALGLNTQVIMWYCNALQKLGLIATIQNGRYKRYYPTELLKTRREMNFKRIKQFRDMLLRKLDDDGLQPELTRSTEGLLIVQIGFRTKKYVLNIKLDPFSTVLAS